MTLLDAPAAGACPRARPDLAPARLGDHVALYDTAGGVLVMLNPSAAAVFERCDGRTPLGSVVDELARRHAVDDATLRREVWWTVHQLVELGLVSMTGQPAGG